MGAVCGGWVLVRGWGHGTDTSAAEAYHALYESRGREGEDARWAMQGLAAGAASVTRGWSGQERSSMLWWLLESRDIDDSRLAEAKEIAGLYRGVVEEGVRVGKLRWVSAAARRQEGEDQPPYLHYDVGASGYLDVLRAMRWAMRAAARRGDWERVEELGGALLGLERLFTCSPSLMSYILHGSMRDGLWRQIRTIANENVIDAETYALLMGLVEEGEDGWEVFARGIEGERLVLLDGLNHAYTSHGFLNARALRMWRPSYFRDADPEHAWGRAVREVRWAWEEATSARRGETERAVRAWRDAWREWLERAPEKRRGTYPEFPEMVRENPFVWTVTGGYLSSEGGTSGTLVRELWKQEDARAATAVMLRLALYRAGAGAWPEKLTDAMGVEAATCPSTGRMFFYCRREDGRIELRREPDRWLARNEDYGPSEDAVEEDALKVIREAVERRSRTRTDD